MEKISFNNQKLLLHFTIVGLGANGSHFFRGLCQDLRTHLDAYESHPYNRPFILDQIFLVDGDRVDRKNLGNQLFEEDDIGSYKAQSLAERYGEAYRLQVLRKLSYIHEPSDLTTFIPQYKSGNGTFYLPVLVGMVDNNATRQILDTFFRSDYTPNMMYLDAGVNGVSFDQHNKPRADTGNGGQIVVGLKINNEVILESVGGVYPEILADQESSVPGCSDMIASAPQRCATNKFAAQIANNVINTLLTEKAILVHQAMFDSRFCGSRPIFIGNEQAQRFESVMAASRKVSA